MHVGGGVVNSSLLEEKEGVELERTQKREREKRVCMALSV